MEKVIIFHSIFRTQKESVCNFPVLNFIHEIEICGLSVPTNARHRMTANFHWVNGDKEIALKIFRKIVAEETWQANGFLAAEAELSRTQ